MDFNTSNNWRNRRNHLPRFPAPFGQFQTMASRKYSSGNTNTNNNIQKSDLEEMITDKTLIHNLHNLENPLQKNLGDYIHMDSGNIAMASERSKNSYMYPSPLINQLNQQSQVPRRDQMYPRFSVLTSMFSGFISRLTGARTYPKQPETPDTPYFECYQYPDQKDSGFDEPDASPKVLNHNPYCDIKNRVIIEKNSVQSTPKPSPISDSKKELMSTSSLDDIYEDAFTPEDFACTDLNQIKNLNIKTGDIGIIESTDIAEPLQEIQTTESKESVKAEHLVKDTNNAETGTVMLTPSIITSCENKLKSIKAMFCAQQRPLILEPSNKESEMKHRRSNNRPIPNNKHCKRYKNPHRQTNKRKGAKMHQTIQDDMRFANEIASFDESPLQTPIEKEHSVDNCFFDEVKGKFADNSVTDSEDSFQIVFTDSPQVSPRTRLVSDCDSEDSFIVFEDGDDCYTSTDIFGNESDIEESDDDNDSDYSDSGCGQSSFRCSNGNLSRTVSDLADSSLYEDPVDYIEDGTDDEVDFVEDNAVFTGILLNKVRKLQKRKLPPKKVQFSAAPPKVHMMHVWTFAARQARAGHWAQYTVDRDRFKRRIADVDMAIAWVLKPQHRSRVKFQRFMPWWHAQRRQEEADKKERAETEKREAESRRIEKEDEESRRTEKEGEENDVTEDSHPVSEVNASNEIVNLNSSVDKTDNIETINNNAKTNEDKKENVDIAKNTHVTEKIESQNELANENSTSDATTNSVARK